jgi:hypothetical protein
MYEEEAVCGAEATVYALDGRLLASVMVGTLGEKFLI